MARKIDRKKTARLTRPDGMNSEPSSVAAASLPPNRNADKPDPRTIMRGLAWVAVALGVVLFATVLCGKPAPAVVQRQSGYNPAWKRTLQDQRPEVILLGNSMIGEGMDDQYMAKLLGRRSIKMWGSGWSSAVWYLAMKNVIGTLNYRPDAVVIFFRDHYLTDPTFRTTGEYQAAVEQFAGPDEPLLDRLAYLQNLDPFTYGLRRHWSLYQKREPLKNALEDKVKLLAGGLCRVDSVAGVDQQIQIAFDKARLEPALLGKSQLQSEDVTDQRVYDFNWMISRSFLPEIIQQARQKDIPLIFVRVKRLREAQNQPAPPALLYYMADLSPWLAQQNCPFFDFSDDARLTPDLYADGDHLNRTHGRQLFTEMVAEKIKPLLRP